MPNPPRTRLYTEALLSPGAVVACDEKRAHYLQHVLRMQEGAGVVLFNGRDGEWIATLDAVRKKSASLTVATQLREQVNSPDLWLICTPLKNARTDWVVEKATELGVSRICPIITRFCAMDKTNESRLQAIAIEAAEQCERMDVPEISPLTTFEKLLGNWPAGRTLLYADESGAGDLLTASLPQGAYAVMVGPEGGFAAAEFALLRQQAFAKAITLGPRILRADTAAIASLAIVQAITGDWAMKPAFRNEEQP